MKLPIPPSPSPTKTTPRCCSVQYRTINIKTTSKEGMEEVMKACLEKPNARLAWMEHPAEGETPVHYHLCGSFTGPVRLADALAHLVQVDPHCYIKPCRNFRASVRYLAHLDNPEKVQLSPEGITLAGDWEGVNLARLFERRAASASLQQLVEYLQEYVATLPSPGHFDRVRFALWLDQQGYSSAKAFGMLRTMGLNWSDLYPLAVASREETPAPAGAPAGGEPLAVKGA